jgi:hypothetical protein
MLLCLGELFHVVIERQTFHAAVGLHGAGGYRAQCGLVEGALMFLGIYLSKNEITESEIIRTCYRFADAFTQKFGSLKCRDLRPGGFTDNDPPHLCEKLTNSAIDFSYYFIKNAEMEFAEIKADCQ